MGVNKPLSVLIFFPWSSSDHPQLSGSEEVKVEEGETLALQCDTRANPLLLSISWELNGSMVDLLADGFTVTSDGVTSALRASKVGKSVHEGTYKCTTNSPSYGHSSKLFHVTVTGQFSCSLYCHKRHF